MRGYFQTAVSEVWASLGEAPPVLVDDAIELHSDDLTLKLEDQLDGESLLVSAEVGPLAMDRMRRFEQIRKILLANLDFLGARRVCAFLRGGTDDMLVVAGQHSYRDGGHALSQLIEDVLFLHQWHNSESLGGAAASPKIEHHEHERDNVIFRP